MSNLPVVTYKVTEGPSKYGIAYASLVYNYLDLTGRNFAYWVVENWHWDLESALPLYVPRFIDKTIYENVDLAVVKCIEFKSSINSFPLDPPVGGGMACYSLEKERHTMKRPIEPKFFPLKFKKPSYPQLKTVVKRPPKLRTPRPHETPLHYSTYVSRIERRYHEFTKSLQERYNSTFKRKVGIWKNRIKRQEDRKTQHFEIYLKRVEKYKVRLNRFNLSLERASHPQKKRSHARKFKLPDNPYTKMFLTSLTDEPFHLIGANDSNYDPTPDSGHLVNWGMHDEIMNPLALRGVFGRNVVSGIASTLLNSLAPLARAEDPRLVRKVYDKVHNQSVHIGNLLAERAQTYELLVTNFKRLSQLILLKKKFIKSTAAAILNPKKWANEILAFKFGVEPLVSDIKGIAEVLSKGIPEEGAIVTVRCNSKRFVSFETEGLDFNGQVEMSYTVKLSVDNPAGRLFSQLGLINPAEIVWEVTPWSFVIDWFLPVGAWIQAQTGIVGLSFISGTRKVKYKGTFDFKSTPTSLFASRTEGQDAYSLKGKFTGYIIDRQVLTSLPDSSLILGIKNPYSPSHLVESISLLIQKIKR